MCGDLICLLFHDLAAHFVFLFLFKCHCWLLCWVNVGKGFGYNLETGGERGILNSCNLSPYLINFCLDQDLFDFMAEHNLICFLFTALHNSLIIHSPPVKVSSYFWNLAIVLASDYDLPS